MLQLSRMMYGSNSRTTAAFATSTQSNKSTYILTYIILYVYIDRYIWKTFSVVTTKDLGCFIWRSKNETKNGKGFARILTNFVYRSFHLLNTFCQDTATNIASNNNSNEFSATQKSSFSLFKFISKMLFFRGLPQDYQVDFDVDSLPSSAA